MGTVNPQPSNQNPYKELIEFQSLVYDKASTYTKIVLGLGYGGFFTAWSGAKQHLPPKTLIAPALFETVSLILFITFEIWQAAVNNRCLIELTKTVNRPSADFSAALETYRQEARRISKPILASYPYIFWACAITGLTGGGILIYAFVAGLFRM